MTLRIGPAEYTSQVICLWLCDFGKLFNLSLNFLICKVEMMSKKQCGGDLVAQSCLTLATPWTVDPQAPLSMGFSRQEYWSRVPFPW